MKKFLVFIFLVLFSFLIIPTSYAQNTDPYMIITNPGENASSMMNISWHMDLGVEDGKIEYTTVDDVNWNNSVTLNANYEKVEIFTMKDFLKYEITLFDLEKDTQYKYRVGSTNLSDTYYFKTAGADEFSFVWVGDWHAYLPIPGRVTSVTNVINKATAIEDIDFLLTTGDMVAYGSDYPAWLNLYANDQYKNFMWSSAIGNHDVMNVHSGSDSDDFFAAVNNNPKNGYQGQEGKSYYFKYGNSLFIVLNTEIMSNISNRVRAQNWAKDVIDNNPADYIFVSMHYNWFSGVTGSNYQYNNWKEFFDNNKVDLAMSGHNHIYVRTHRLFNDEIDNENGTVYMQNPSSDNDRGRETTGIVQNADKIVTVWTENTYTVGAIIVTVNKDSINTRLIDRQGNIQDETYISKREKEETIFSKQDFIESVIYVPSTLNPDSGIISASVTGVGKVDKIEYYNQDELLATNYFYQMTHSSFVISNISTVDTIKVIVYFNDNTNKTTYLKVVNSDYYKINKLEVLIDDSIYKLKWNYDSNNNLKAWVFIDDVPFKEVSLIDKEVVLGNIDKESIISIRPDKDSLNKYYYTKYSIFGDANSDGNIDTIDVLMLQEYLLNNSNNFDIDFVDIDFDGELTMVDITYIHLYISGIVQKLENIELKVSFLNFLGQNKHSVNVNLKGSAAYSGTVIPENYKFIGWNTDLSSINDDLIVYPIFEYMGENND